MDPNKNETWAQLIARRPERLNILVQRITNTTTYHGDDTIVGNGVCVRYGYSCFELEDDPRLIGVFVDGHSDWSPTALNQINQPGAFIPVPDVQGIRDAVAMLRETWGPLHVQDNSGLVPDLHQGAFQG